MLVGHGDDGYRHHKDIVADFSTNVWYGGSPAGLKEHIISRWDKIHKYPEVLGESLTSKIASHHQLDSGHILVANGTTESIYLIAQVFKGKRTTILIPSFSEYEDACRLHDHDISLLNWEELYPESMVDTDVLFICNPNNPTGFVFKDIESLILCNPNVIFVIDEAFIEFTLSISSVIGLVEKYDNAIVMRSMTKAYAIPGLRLGYIASSVKIIKKLTELKLPWTVNVLALEAGHYIFDHYEELSLPLQQLLIDKESFIKRLTGSILNVSNIMCPSHTHFFLAQTTWGSSASLKQFLLKDFDILIRDASNFKGLNDKSIRICTLSKDKNELLINSLLSC